ncbi:MAG: methyltransferase domain-containing protein, partial [Halothiobacillus sp.]|nr:methyltransferase domain-containing protein [Halothiobacillus sp.]
LKCIRAEAEALDLPEYPVPTLRSPQASDTGRLCMPEARYIQHLLLIPKENFLREAYRRLLQREADPSGLEHYQGMMSEDHTRTEILFVMANSPEGRALEVTIAGLGWIPALLCRLSLKIHRYSSQRVHAALRAGRGGLLGRLTHNIPDPLLKLLLQPLRLNHLPSLWLRAWEQRLIQPFEFIGQWFCEQQQRAETLEHQLREHTEEYRQFSEAQAKRQLELQQSQQELQQSQQELQQSQQELQQSQQELQQSQQELQLSQRELEKTLDWLRYSVSHQWHKQLSTLPPPTSPTSPALAVEQEALDAFYIAFENACRGHEADIRAGLRVYLEYVHRSAAAQGHPIIDLGCGRGEWLRILKEEGFNARGIDQSPAMVEHAKAYGLDVEQGDAVAALARLPESSVGGITGFHIIEHLPFPVLFRLFAEVARVLVPGGIAIFETPNPENLLVGSHTFYHDPTHRHPITPTFITFLAQYHGLGGIEILRLHPYPESAKVPGHDPLTERVNGHLCGPQDFALIAYRPHPA